jgi:hypothetical protein
LGDDACVVGACIDTESLEGGEKDENSGPTVIETEWDVDPDYILWSNISNRVIIGTELLKSLRSSLMLSLR